MGFGDFHHRVFNHRFLRSVFSFEVTISHLHYKKRSRAEGVSKGSFKQYLKTIILNAIKTMRNFSYQYIFI